VDPVTGLSRRQAIALAFLIPLGIVASTVATAISEQVDSRCPDERYECATLQEGEPVILGLVAASDASMDWPLTEAVEQGIGNTAVEGHPVLVDIRLPGCDAEAASQDVRELASDPPDEPPAAAVVGALCAAAAVPMAQILSDTGTTLVALNEVPPVPTTPPYHLVGPELDLRTETSGLQGVGVASHLRQLVASHVGGVLEHVAGVIDRVAIRDGARLLIPRTALRDALVRDGFSPA
jgi:hypothetical protein